MAIQVWDGTKYIGAELGRFGPSGTLKEALIWDGTKYVKVWPNKPAYPVSGEWAGSIGSSLEIIASHTIVDAGTYTITVYVTGATQHIAGAMRNGNDRDSLVAGGPATGKVGGTATVSLSAGDSVDFVTYGNPGPATGTWSIVKS